MAVQHPRLRGRTVVITAGPTREHLDDIRFLSNASTGRMGLELARAARRRGAEVVLVLGPCALPRLKGVEMVNVVSTDDLLRATRRASKDADLVIFAAAPADWKPAQRRRGKPKREGGDVHLTLRSTPDVAATLGKRKGGRVHVGFALEVDGGAARARRKLARKNLDAIVLNSPANLGAGGGEASWIPAEGAAEALPNRSKAGLARAVLDRATALLR
jgi:phosphopantothenoylcysteine decarboxylase/phosphopantothenate--cysteine ligase